MPITPLVAKLAKDGNWRKMRDYRDKWVHEHPPTVEDSGIVHHRRNPWEKTSIGYKMGLGEGDEPELNIGQIEEFVVSVFKRLVKVAKELLDYYESTILLSSSR